MSNIRFTRPVGTDKPFTFAHPHRVAVKPVYLGNRNPGTLIRRAMVSGDLLIRDGARWLKLGTENRQPRKEV
jgi:hypothetical protein